MSDAKPIKVVKRQTLNQRVYQILKSSILDGSLSKGTKLSEQQMAASLGVSATPVREAFRMLAMEGLLKIEPWKGAVVQGFTEEETLEAVQCREALEVMALRLVFDRLTDEDIDQIEALVERARHAEDINTFSELSSKIHDVWILGCGNKRLVSLMKQLDDVLLHDRSISAGDSARKAQIIAEHTEILAAFRTRDLPRATAALTAHIRNGCDYSISKHREAAP